jgi:hypothetical protein
MNVRRQVSHDPDLFTNHPLTSCLYDLNEQSNKAYPWLPREHSLVIMFNEYLKTKRTPLAHAAGFPDARWVNYTSEYEDFAKGSGLLSYLLTGKMACIFYESSLNYVSVITKD